MTNKFKCMSCIYYSQKGFNLFNQLQDEVEEEDLGRERIASQLFQRPLETHQFSSGATKHYVMNFKEFQRGLKSESSQLLKGHHRPQSKSQTNLQIKSGSKPVLFLPSTQTQLQPLPFLENVALSTRAESGKANLVFSNANRKQLPNINQFIKQKVNLQQFRGSTLQNKNNLFRDKGSLQTGTCDCVLCRRVFGLPKHFITVYPYRNAALDEAPTALNNETQKKLSRKARRTMDDETSLNASDLDDEQDETDSPEVSLEAHSLRYGKLCAGFHKEEGYLMLAFNDFEQEDEQDYQKQCLHFIDMREFMESYQYNIQKEDFLRTL